MSIWSAVLEKDGQCHTFLGRVFDALEGRQRDYNFLLVGVEAYPGTPDFQFVNQAPVWMSGEELTRMIRQEDFQWVWGGAAGLLNLLFQGADSFGGPRPLCPGGL